MSKITPISIGTITANLRPADINKYNTVITDPRLAANIRDIRAKEMIIQGMDDVLSRFNIADDIADDTERATWVKGKALKAEQEALKKNLPVMAANAVYKDGRRLKDNALRTPYTMMDIDGYRSIDEVEELCRHILSKKDEIGLMLLKISPRQHGAHLIFDALPGVSIPECVARTAQLLGVQPDMAVTTTASCCFMSPESDHWYLDPALFSPTEIPEWLNGWDEEAAASSWKRQHPVHKNSTITLTTTPAPLTTTTTPAPAPIAVTTTTEVVKEYEGIPLSDIAAALLDQNGGVPHEGSRNTTFFAAACQLARIASNEESLYQAFSTFSTLPTTELREVCKNALKAVAKDPDNTLTTSLRTLIDDLRDTPSDIDLIESTDIDFPLPPVLSTFYKVSPESHKKGMVLALLPILGALACQLRARYNDFSIQYPYFQTVIVGLPASGKSLFTRAAERCLRAIDEADAKSMAAHTEWESSMAKLNALKNQNKEEKAMLMDLMSNEPAVVQQHVPERMSRPEILQIMHDAKPLAIIQIATEISDVISAFEASHTDLASIIRHGFEAEGTGQQYKTKDKTKTFNGSVKCRVNLLYLAQPYTVAQLYDIAAFHNGTTSRTLFYDLPHEIGAEMPIMHPLTPAEEADVDAHLARLYAVSRHGDEVMPEHFIDIPWLNKCIAKWCQAERIYMRKHQDAKRDAVFARSAVVGFRAGVLAWFLFGEKDTPTVRKNVCKFARWTANMMMKGLLPRIPDIAIPAKKGMLCPGAYNALPVNFTREQLIAALQANNCASTPSRVLGNWNKINAIDPKGYGQQIFRKITQ